MKQSNVQTLVALVKLSVLQMLNHFSPLLLKLADDPNVIIAKMDATANDVPSPYEVSG